MNNKPENTGESRNEKGQFKPGYSGNPDGKPEGSLSITTEIKKKLKEIPEGQQKTYLELLINKIMHKAIVEGDQTTLKAIWNYIDGLPRESIDVTSDGKPITSLLANVRGNNSATKNTGSEEEN